MAEGVSAGPSRGMVEGAWFSGFAALCVGQFLAHQTALTFSALIPVLSHEWRLTAGQAGLILGVFQLGQLTAYVLVGLLLDRVPSKPIMVCSAALVGGGDFLFALVARDFTTGLALRLLEGLLLGGLYLPALKYIAETIPEERRGRAAGVYLAALVSAYGLPLLYVGSLVPHVGWRATVAASGVLESVGALIIASRLPSVPMRGASAAGGLSRYVGDVLRNARARRVILAYAAHNWELFGMWGWMTPFMVASLTAQGNGSARAMAWGGAFAAAVIGVGGSIGAVMGGRLSDFLGRARAASLMLAVSFLCSLAFGWLLHTPPSLLLGVGVLYGIAALGDSPSYSVTLMEVVAPRSLGGAFSVFMLLGWSATILAPAVFGMTLDLVKAAHASSTVAWAAAFGILALGPLVGLIALAPLRAVTHRETGVLGTGPGGTAR